MSVRGSVKWTPDAFWSVVRGADSACWPWPHGRGRRGYGKIHVAGRTWQTHRYAWVLTHGEPTPGLCICHRCDNPTCCNPAHLFMGTHLDNRRDCMEKGRHAVRSILVDGEVHSITAWARVVGVHPSAISHRIRRGQRAEDAVRDLLQRIS